MVTRSEKKKKARNWAEKQYDKHRRHNMFFAKPGVHDFVIVLDNLKATFNIGKIFRSGDAFGVREIHIIGTDYFETSSAKGSFKWVPAVFHATFAECYRSLHDQGYAMHILDPEADACLQHIDFVEKSAFIFGHEEHGISFDRSDYEDILSVKVPQFGRVESLNVSIAASIVMYEYLRQQGERTGS